MNIEWIRTKYKKEAEYNESYKEFYVHVMDHHRTDKSSQLDWEFRGENSRGEREEHTRN